MKNFTALVMTAALAAMFSKSMCSHVQSGEVRTSQPDEQISFDSNMIHGTWIYSENNEEVKINKSGFEHMIDITDECGLSVLWRVSSEQSGVFLPRNEDPKGRVKILAYMPEDFIVFRYTTTTKNISFVASFMKVTTNFDKVNGLMKSYGSESEALFLASHSLVTTNEYGFPVPRNFRNCKLVGEWLSSSCSAVRFNVEGRVRRTLHIVFGSDDLWNGIRKHDPLYITINDKKNERGTGWWKNYRWKVSVVGFVRGKYVIFLASRATDMLSNKQKRNVLQAYKKPGVDSYEVNKKLEELRQEVWLQGVLPKPKLRELKPCQ